MTTMTASEQMLLEMTNRARLDPAAEAARLGIDLNQYIQQSSSGFPITTEAKQVLAGSNTLQGVAERHADVVWNNPNFPNIDAHNGAGDGTVVDRIANAGYSQNALSWYRPENFALQQTSEALTQAQLQTLIERTHDSLFIDDPAHMFGEPGGHRLAMMDPNMKEMGAGTKTGVLQGWNTLMTFENFGVSGTQSFLTGAVYDDTVRADNFYTIGEGRSGVTATVKNAAGTTIGSDITGSGGGFSVGEPGGTHSITFSGGGLAGAVSATVEAGNLNAKVDLVNGNRIEATASTTLGGGAKDLRLLGMADVNGTGNGFANAITGNKGANVLEGKGGNDTLDGAAGLDTAVLSGNRVDYQVTVLSGTSARLTDLRGNAPDGTDTILNIEKVKFADQTVNFSDLRTTTPAPTVGSVAINDVSITEGNSGTKVATFTVTRSGGSAAFDVNIGTANGTATTADADYVAKSGTLKFATGINTQSFSVTLNGDTKVESNETFKAVLSGITNGGTIADAQGIATLINDDTATAPKVGSVAINDVTITEGNAGTKVATFTVTRSGGSAAFDVNAATANGSATTADGDYVAKSDTLHFAAGVNTQTFSVTIKGDTKVEVNETFKAMLSGITNGGTIGDAQGVGTITNDDAAANRAPVVTTQNASVATKAAVAASSLFAAHDADGDATITQYGFWDTGSAGGYFTVGGVKQVSGAWITVDKADLASVKYVGAATSGASEKLYVTAFDGKAWSPSVALTAATVARPDADFNGDGKNDILWHTDGGKVALWQMDGSHIALNTSVGTVASTWHVEGSDDFNGDNKADVLLHHDNGTVALWQMNGSQIAASATVGKMTTDWHVAAIDDFTGDGKADILWNSDAGKVALWQMNGSTLVANKAVGQVGSGWHIEDAADFSGDGKADILLRHDASGDVAMWTMNGAQVASTKTFGTIGTTWDFAGTGDFGGDGKADILWRHDNGNVALWQMNGTNVAHNDIVGSAPTAWNIADTGDYNRDGHDDILWQHGNGSVAMWQMDGAQIASNVTVGSIGSEWHI